MLLLHAKSHLMVALLGSCRHKRPQPHYTALTLGGKANRDTIGAHSTLITEVQEFVDRIRLTLRLKALSLVRRLEAAGAV